MAITIKATTDALLPLRDILAEPPLERSASTSATDPKIKGRKTGTESVEKAARTARIMDILVSLSRGDGTIVSIPY